jgi:hypothetical protein
MLLEVDDQRRRAAQFRVLTARFACRAASQLLVRNTWDSLWLLAFSDVAEQAVVRGNVNAATELLTFLVTPIISSFTDAYGRRAGQVFCAVCNLFYQLCGLTLGLQGSVNGLIAGQFFFALAQQGQTLQRASMGDLYMADPVQYTSALSSAVSHTFASTLFSLARSQLSTTERCPSLYVAICGGLCWPSSLNGVGIAGVQTLAPR